MLQNPFSKFDKSKTVNPHNLPASNTYSVEKFLEKNKDSLVLDLGAGNCAMKHPRIVQVDLVRYANTGVLGDAMA
ncbi:MAG: hypothetical protein ACE5GQ_11005, partial [Nitrospinales bacterium]